MIYVTIMILYTYAFAILVIHLFWRRHRAARTESRDQSADDEPVISIT